MSYFNVWGGRELKGEIEPQGAKNEALQVISAVLLTEESVEIHNIPNIRDVNLLIEILKNLGVSVEKINENAYKFCAKNLHFEYLESKNYTKLASSFRGSLLLLGPLLYRFNKVQIPQPGGDKIGRRKIDTHFKAFQKLGVKVSYHSETKLYHLSKKKESLKGTYILLDEASVTGTANALMAACMAKGTTTLYNAACEPYLQQLCKMLNKMGAKIEGVGSNLLHIQGVDKLSGTSHTLLPDMIEIGSFIGLAAITESELTIKNTQIHNLGIIPSTFEKLGIKLKIKEDDIHIPKQHKYEIVSSLEGAILTISDAIWPGLTPDLLSIILVTAIQAKGTVLIHQKMFESRLFFVDKLIDMGAQIILCDPHRATVIGLNKKFKLKGISMSSPDIRAGIALLIAALSAQGKSTIHNVDQIDRGYEFIDKRLNALGAKIERVHDSF